jgi:exonuclease SbcC
MIRSITLANWRSHEKTELQFAKGTNIIIGIMGAGKSSVLEGICFALFGTFPALQARKLKTSDIVRSRPEQAAEASVEIVFDAPDGIAYSVTRTIPRGKGGATAELRKDGKLIESAPERVTDYVQKLLRIDYDLFTRAIFSEQNRIDYFLTLSPSDRKRKIDELLGIDRFETVRANVKGAIARLRAEADATKVALSGQKPDRMKSDLEKMQKEQADVKEKGVAGEKRLKAVEVELKEISERLRAAEQKRTRWMELEKSKARHEQTIADLAREMARAEKGVEKGAAKAEASLTSVVSELHKTEESISESSREATSASSHLGSIGAKLDDMQAIAVRNEKLRKTLATISGGGTSESLKADHASSREKLDKLRKSLAEAEAALSSAEEAERALSKAGATCPVCDEPLGDAKKKELSERRRHEIEKARSLASALKSDSAAKSKEASELDERLRKAIELQASITAIDESELKRLAAEREKLDASVKFSVKRGDELKAKRAELEKSLRTLEKEATAYKELEEKKERAHLAQKEMAHTISELSKVDHKEEDVHKAQAELRKCEAERSALENDLGHWNTALSRLNGDLAELRSRMQEYEAHTSKIAGWEKRAEELDIFGNAIVDVQASLRTELIDAINSAMSSVWQTVYPYGDYSHVRLSADEAGYELELGEGGNWTSAEGSASGGERACACLALRIAFARVLVPNLSWLILDEPTHNLDEEAVRTLAGALREDIPAIVDQVFVITHEEGLKDAASGNVYLLDRNKRHREATVARRLSVA